MTPFKPEYAGKMNFYLSAVDDLFRHPDDKPSIGLILCKTKNRIIAEYALRNMATPMGISEFTHLEKLPERTIGLSLERFIENILEREATASSTNGSQSLTGGEKAKAFRAWANSFPADLPVLSLEGVSRESVYRRD
jgi:hypothetical protein